MRYFQTIPDDFDPKDFIVDGNDPYEDLRAVLTELMTRSTPAEIFYELWELSTYDNGDFHSFDEAIQEYKDAEK
jgi:hypothetical protein